MKSSKKLQISSYLLIVYINNQDRKWCLSVLVFSSTLTEAPVVTSVKPAIRLLRNMWKRSQNAKNKKCIAGNLRHFFHISHTFSRFSLSHFTVFRARGSAFTRKVEGFCGLFFATLIKHEIRMKYEKYIVSVSYFLEIPEKCEIWKGYSRPKDFPTLKHQ